MYELHKRQFAYTGGKLLIFSTPSKMINDKNSLTQMLKKTKKETKIVKKTKVFLNSRGKDGNYVSIYEEF